MNLFDQKLYRLTLPTDGSAPRAEDVASFMLPANGKRTGMLRPFAVKCHQEQVLIGAVLDASLSDRTEHLRALIFSFSPQRGKFTELFSTPLGYARGVLDYGVNGPCTAGWRPWTDDYEKTLNGQHDGWMIYPQPILADIEVDTDGSLVLGLMDRLGHQTADGQLYHPTQQPQLRPVRGLSGGDVLRVAFVNGRYQLEHNGIIRRLMLSC